jgi:hypothetical protein|tara:strand:+ start:387 stop:1100 length:714 start_codon:yes stop_codon:yes gene_type:complete
MILITLDIDWAPDFIIKKVDEMLTEKNVKATWFVTHKSAYLKTLSKNRNYELGIHPNFMSDSTQGNSIEEILSNLKKIVPTAKSVRTHRLFQSTQILETFHKYDLENDSSLLKLNPNDVPYYLKSAKLYRFPYFWEDYKNMVEDKIWSLPESLFEEDELKIFNFHPLHIYLNFHNIEQYETFKVKNGYRFSDKSAIDAFINKNSDGVQTFFRDFISALANKQTAYTIQEVKTKIFNS